jgi:hypothetical protein
MPAVPTAIPGHRSVYTENNDLHVGEIDQLHVSVLFLFDASTIYIKLYTAGN